MRPMVVHLSSPVEFLPISTKCSVYAEMAVSEFKLHLWQTGLHWIQVDGWRSSRIILGQLRALRAEMHLWRSRRLERSHRVAHRVSSLSPQMCLQSVWLSSSKAACFRYQGLSSEDQLMLTLWLVKLLIYWFGDWPNTVAGRTEMGWEGWRKHLSPCREI